MPLQQLHDAFHLAGPYYLGLAFYGACKKQPLQLEFTFVYCCKKYSHQDKIETLICNPRYHTLFLILMQHVLDATI